ncbi:hypothetical protein [Legionella cardiaca]|uniref:Uncharacterized protein n=1 Tax=Legionella cardiaca TaxID=1071983 RepID=A0ABY8APU5_9GAMM|nr:hypothetical protein [Legionella cardiaca]WED41814.1 hypothetical protein PXX05_07665 [Legionella cardiaca]
MAKPVLMGTQTQNLHSDHHPSIFGKTLIWNLDKDNGATSSPKDLGKGLEMEAYAIAQKINAGDIDSGMLQELPVGQQAKFVAAIEKYLDEPKPKLEWRYAQAKPHEFGNLTFQCKDKSAPSAIPTADDLKLQAEVAKLQQKYEGAIPPKGQALISLVEGTDGKKRLLVNVHAESEKSMDDPDPKKRTPRVNLEQLTKDLSALKDKHDIEVTVGGDMNAGKTALPRDLGNGPSSDFVYQHSADNSSFKRDGTGVSVDAVVSTDKNSQLKTAPDMNTCNTEFVKQFDKDKKAKESLEKKALEKSEAELASKFATSPNFNNAKVRTGNVSVAYREDESQVYAVKLTFRDANQARQFTNLMGINSRKQLFQNEGDVYLTREAFAKVMKADLSQPKAGPVHQEKLAHSKLVELQQICKEKAQSVSDTPITKEPSIEYKNASIRQDTRGVVNYSMQLTFASKEEARAFSDAMGYKNKTKLFQEGNKVYIAKDTEADFLKKTCMKDNAIDYKARLGSLVQSKKTDVEPALNTQSQMSPKLSH